jgi:hypothetical protein
MFKQVAIVALFAVMTYGFNVESDFGPGSHVARRSATSGNATNNNTNNNNTANNTNSNSNSTNGKTTTANPGTTGTNTGTDDKTNTGTTGTNGKTNTGTKTGNQTNSKNGTTTTDPTVPAPGANEETVQTLTVEATAAFGKAFEALTVAAKATARTDTANTITDKMTGVESTDVDTTHILKNKKQITRRNRRSDTYTIELVFKSGVSAAKVTTGLENLKTFQALTFTINGTPYVLDMSKVKQGAKNVKKASATSSVASALLFISAVAVAALL